MLFLSIVKKYIQKYCSNSPKPSTTKEFIFCSRCKNECRFHIHSYRERKCVFLSGKWLLGGTFRIVRKRCSQCDKVISMFPSFLGKYQRIQIPLIFAFLKMLGEGKTFAYAVKHCFEKLSMSERSYWRWKAKWNNMLTSLCTSALKFILQFIPTLNIDKASKTPVFRQLSDAVLELKNSNPQFKLINSVAFILGIHFKNSLNLPLSGIPPNLSD